MKIKEPPMHGEMGHFCHGGCAGYAKGGKVTAGLDGIDKNPDPEPPPPDRGTAGLEGVGYSEGGQIEAAEAADEKDPSEIPEDIKEFIEKAHKDKRESRPDEGWRVTPAKKEETIAPYKKDEEMESESEISGDMGGLMGFAGGGEVPDQNDLLQQLAPPGVGTLVPSPAMPPPAPAPMESPVAAAPMAAAKPAAPAPGLTDDDFMNRANKMLGLNSGEQAGFMKLLGDNAQKGQIGAGLAGIGDAIASGGTLGKVNPGALSKSEDIISGKTKAGIDGMQTIRENQGKAHELADKLESRDPKSPLSKWAQKAYAGVGKKIGLDLSNASAAMIGDVAGKGVDALNTEYQNQLKMMGLNLQSKQIDATIANQAAERENSKVGRKLEAAKAVAGRGIADKVVGLIPGTTANASNKVLEDAMSDGPVKVDSMEQYKALPSGTHYVDSHGTEKVKK